MILAMNTILNKVISEDQRIQLLVSYKTQWPISSKVSLLPCCSFLLHGTLFPWFQEQQNPTWPWWLETVKKFSAMWPKLTKTCPVQMNQIHLTSTKNKKHPQSVFHFASKNWDKRQYCCAEQDQITTKKVSTKTLSTNLEEIETPT